MQRSLDCADSTQDHGGIEMAHMSEAETIDASDPQAEDQASLLFAQGAEFGRV
jgi:hypothetical protein